jgi:uncharacterized protein (TIGR00369 family)
MTAHPIGRRSAAEQARVEEVLQDRVRNVPFNTLIGVTVVSIRPPEPRLRLDMRPTLVGTREHSRLHGGAIATVLDDIGGIALMVALADKHPDETAEQLLHRFVRMGTIDLRIDYLRPGLGEHFIASAEVTRLGGRIGSTTMRLVNDENKLIATGTATYIMS